MKKAKIIWLILVTCILALGLASCKNADPDNSGNTPGTTSDDVIYSPSVSATLVLGEGLDGNYANAIGTAYYKLTGSDITIASYTSEPKAHEIIVGKTGREISEKAYRSLELMRTEDTIGYVIYSDGKSVAIAFDEAIYSVDIAFSEAMKHFVSKYMTEATLKLDSGPVGYEIFYPFEKQEKLDAEYEEIIWNYNSSYITQILGGDETVAVDIIKKLENLKGLYGFDFDIVKWLANLYDLDTGAFYYSNSARNYTGYLPDVVSTDKAFDIIETMLEKDGMKISDLLEEKAVIKLLTFTKGLQKEDGNFYHPQWEDGLIAATSDRKIADSTSALNILYRFGALPTYDVGDVKGEGVTAPVSSIMMPFTESRTKAVSLVLSANNTSDIYIPPHLSSEKRFESYLMELKISTRTANACKTIYADLAQYKAIDDYNEKNGVYYRLCDTLIGYMASVQKNNGLWSSGDADINAIANLIDIVKIYNALGIAIPRYQLIFNTISDFAVFSEGAENLTDIANTWSALAAVVENVRTYSAEYEKAYVDEAMANLYSEIGEALDGTQKALAEFIRSYHSFSLTIGGGDSTYLGMPSAEANTDEGNIIATAIAVTEIYPAIFKALDLKAVPLFSTSDRMMFADTLAGLGALIKMNAADNFKYDKFENYELGILSELSYEKYLGSDDTYFEIIKDTVTSTRENSNVLKWYAAAAKSFNQIVVERKGEAWLGANAGFFEGDIKLESILDKEVKINFNLRSSKDNHNIAYSLGVLLNPNGSPLTLSSADFKSTLDVSEGEWFKLRLEYTDSVYDYNYDGVADIIYRVYINGELAGEGYTPRNPDKIIVGTSIDDIAIQIATGSGACIYFDNLVVGQCKMIYDAPPPEDTDTITYEPGFITDMTKPVFDSSSSAAQISNTDVYGSVSRVLKFYSAMDSADELIISPTLENDSANAITFETDIKIDPAQDSATIYLEPRISSGAIPFRLVIKAGKNGTVTVSSIDIPETVIGKCGEWIHIKVEYMSPRIDYTGDGTDDLLYKIYVDDSKEAVATGYKPYTFGAYYTPLSIKNYVLTFENDSEVTVCLDNTRFWQEILVPDNEPESEDDGSGTLNGPDGDKTDMGGWT